MVALYNPWFTSSLGKEEEAHSLGLSRTHEEIQSV